MVERGHCNASNDHKIPFSRQNDRGAMHRGKTGLANVQLPPEGARYPISRVVGKGRSLAELEREDHRAS